MEFYTAVKNLIAVIFVYLLVMFIFYDYLPLRPIPNPPMISEYSPLGLVNYVLSMLGYLFAVFFVIISNVIVIMSMSFVPYPFNIILSIPINAIFILSIIVIVKEIAKGIGNVIPLPI